MNLMRNLIFFLALTGHCILSYSQQAPPKLHQQAPSEFSQQAPSKFPQETPPKLQQETPPKSPQEAPAGFPIEKLDKEVLEWMHEGNIPGLSLVLINGDSQVIRTYGYSDLEQKKAVTPQTIFELGSCTKAFTALAVLQLVQQGKLRLDDPVAKYLPWLKVSYKHTAPVITIRQLLHHTSGIPWSTISEIPQGDGADALEQTVRRLIGQELNNAPGKKYEYATINYDVLALIIQQLTAEPFEKYLQDSILSPLQLVNTAIGRPTNPARKATGYKISFFSPREYNAPVFRGNNAAGYVNTNAADLAKWVKFQLGLTTSPLYQLADSTHQRDETVPLHDMSSYAMGWQVSLNGNGAIYHDGYNPNFTSYIGLLPKNKQAIALLANANSTYTTFIGDRILRILAGEEIKKQYDPGDRNDRGYSVIAIVTGCYILIVIALLARAVSGILKKQRRFDRSAARKYKKLLLLLVILLPFLAGLYILPKALTNFSWEALLVWSPVSLPVAILLILLSVCLSYLSYAVGMLFPEKDPFKRIGPRLVLFSILSGLANMALIILITSSLDSTVELGYLVFYFLLAFSVYLIARRYVQARLIRFSREITYDMRIEMVDKIFSTTYQKFEKIDRGQIYTVLNDDVITIGDTTGMLITLVASCITAIGAFAFLATIAFWSTMLTLGLLAILLALSHFVSSRISTHFEKARDTQNAFMRLTNNMIDGFKELTLHRNKKLEYKSDIAAAAGEFKERITYASIRFVDVNLIGESLLIICLGMVAFAFPKVFPNIPTYTIMNFIIILLYLVAPVSGILGSIPSILRLKIAWRRINQFLKDIPVNTDLLSASPPVPAVVTTLEVRDMKFAYKGQRETFTVGPINLQARSGEILFIIGGNGSGKTTLAKLLTGLYEPDEGSILINNEPVGSDRLGEHYSVVFSPLYLFEKLYDTDVDGREAELKKYLQLLHLDDKVDIRDSRYSTLDLSGGQRKRLALLQCYLEKAPIYLFDEWAADQDPEYRRFFYRVLLPQMKREGKLIIAITHDDHYFDVADTVLRMDQGQLKTIGKYAGVNTVSL